MSPRVRTIADDERPWLAEQAAALWGAPTVVSRGRVHEPASLPALVAEADGAPIAFVAYEIVGDACEVVALAALRRHAGAGTALLSAVAAEARRHGCARLWLVTTNDNVDALRFYQRRGLRLVAVHAGSIAAARALKPQIPLVGEHGIPIRDELELELALG